MTELSTLIHKTNELNQELEDTEDLDLSELVGRLFPGAEKLGKVENLESWVWDLTPGDDNGAKLHVTSLEGDFEASLAL